MKKKSKAGPATGRKAEPRPDVIDAMPMTLRCRQCGAALTRALRPLPTPSPLALADGVDALPRGFFWHSPDGAELWPSAGPSTFVVNRHELEGLKPVGDRSGCCGPSGMGGPNLACPAGHPVATEVADCWSPHMGLFGPRAALCVPAAGASEPEAQVLVVGGSAPLQSSDAFAAWAHDVLGATDWHGNDIGALVREWLARTGSEETACIVWLNAEASARAGVNVKAIEGAIEHAQEGSPRRRLALVFG